MADETTTTVANLLREQRGPLVQALRWSTVLMAEIERDQKPQSFDGSVVKIPVVLAPRQGTGFTTEQGTLNVPRTLSHTKVQVDTGIAATTVSFSTKAALAAKGDMQSWIDLIPDTMQMAEDGLKRTINESFCGAGTALLAAITAGANSATQTIGAAANFYQLYAERYVDIVQRTTGAVLAAGVKISDYDDAAGTVTFNSVVNVPDANYGIYYEGSWGNAIAGLGSAVTTTGTFQTLDKAATRAWRGTDITPAAVSDPTLGTLAKAERKAQQNSGTTPDFYLCDPAVVDQYELGLTVQARWSGDTGKLASGFEGITYRGKVLIREFDMPSNTVYGVKKDDIRIYTRDDGPDWDERDGGMFKRFSRALPFEAWLVWMLQMGFLRCNSQVKIGNMRQAT